MPIPVFVAAGTVAATATGGGTSLSVPLPAGIQANDILTLTAESSNEPITVSGWSNIGTGTVAQATGLVTSLTNRWLRYTGSETAPTITIAAGGNHIVARIAAWRGCVTSGSPINGTPATSADNGTTTAVSIPGGTTTAADCLVVASFSTGQDVTLTTNVTGWTNASLASPGITELFDNWNVTGNGGGFGEAYGGKAAFGPYNATTATLTTGNAKACISFALQGATTAAASLPILVMPTRN